MNRNTSTHCVIVGVFNVSNNNFTDVCKCSIDTLKMLLIFHCLTDCSKCWVSGALSIKGAGRFHNNIDPVKIDGHSRNFNQCPPHRTITWHLNSQLLTKPTKLHTNEIAFTSITTRCSVSTRHQTTERSTPPVYSTNETPARGKNPRWQRGRNSLRNSN